eukprot:COSAG01_NODE_24_length_37608_cov_19.303154_15_plen_78_part_00
MQRLGWSREMEDGHARARALASWDTEAPAWQRVAAQLRAQLALQQAAGVSKRLVVESPWAQLTSERQRCGHPPRRNN